MHAAGSFELRGGQNEIFSQTATSARQQMSDISSRKLVTCSEQKCEGATRQYMYFSQILKVLKPKVIRAPVFDCLLDVFGFGELAATVALISSSSSSSPASGARQSAQQSIRWPVAPGQEKGVADGAVFFEPDKSICTSES